MRVHSLVGPLVVPTILTFFSAIAAAQQNPPQSHPPLSTALTALPEEPAVDPELAAAIAADWAASPAAPAASTEAAPSPSPMAKMLPDLSFVLDVGAGVYGKGDHLRQGGHAIDDNGVKVQGLELVASASVDPYFRFDLNFQLTEAEVEEAYLTTLALPFNLQARAGLMNAAFGRENSEHLHAWRFANPPLCHTRFLSAEHLRGPGAELSVLLPLPWFVSLTGEAFGTTEELGFSAATFGASEATHAGRINGLEDLLYVLRLEHFFELAADWSLLFGLSEAIGHSAWSPDARAYLHGADLYLKWRPISGGRSDFALSLTVEYLLRDAAAEDGRLRDHGGFAELGAQLSNRWVVAVRYDTTEPWTGVPADAELGWQRRGSAALTFLPTHFSKLRLQGDLSRDEARDGFGWAAFLQAEVSAGEHGAHKF